MYPNGRVVGLFSEGGSPVALSLFSVSLSALQLLRVKALQYSESMCQLNSGIRYEGPENHRKSERLF